MKTTVYDAATGKTYERQLSEGEIKAFNPPEKPYDVKRANAYPDFREYLDGIVKNDQAQIQAYIDACLAVKAKYPKT